MRVVIFLRKHEDCDELSYSRAENRVVSSSRPSSSVALSRFIFSIVFRAPSRLPVSRNRAAPHALSARRAASALRPCKAIHAFISTWGSMLLFTTRSIGICGRGSRHGTPCGTTPNRWPVTGSRGAQRVERSYARGRISPRSVAALRVLNPTCRRRWPPTWSDARANTIRDMSSTLPDNCCSSSTMWGRNAEKIFKVRWQLNYLTGRALEARLRHHVQSR